MIIIIRSGGPACITWEVRRSYGTVNSCLSAGLRLGGSVPVGLRAALLRHHAADRRSPHFACRHGLPCCGPPCPAAAVERPHCANPWAAPDRRAVEPLAALEPSRPQPAPGPIACAHAHRTCPASISRANLDDDSICMAAAHCLHTCTCGVHGCRPCAHAVLLSTRAPPITAWA